MDIKVKNLTDKNINDVIGIHMATLDQDILPALGAGFLKEYYKYVLDKESQVLIGAFAEKRLAGFCQLSLMPISVIDILKRKPLLSFSVFSLAFKNFKMLLKAFLTVSERKKINRDIPEISFIAIDGGYQGKGIGKLLAMEMNRVLIENNKESVMTKTSSTHAYDMYMKLFDVKLLASQTVFGEKYLYLTWDVIDRDKV